MAGRSRSLLSPGLSSLYCLPSHLLFLEGPLEVPTKACQLPDGARTARTGLLRGEQDGLSWWVMLVRLAAGL